MDLNLDSQLHKLATQSVAKQDALAKAERHELDFLLQDGWVYRRLRDRNGQPVQLRDGGLVRQRPASEFEVALWDSLR
jgi:hypothetical protein